MVQLSRKLSSIFLVSCLSLLLSACALQANSPLEALDQQISSHGPYSYRCNENIGAEIVITFYTTEPSSLVAKWGDSESRMTLQPSGSGNHYLGQNASFWEHQGEARVVWGYDTPAMLCHKKQ